MFDLETTEKRLIIILLAALIVGVGIIAYKKSFPAGSLRIESYGDPAGSRGRDISRKDRKININKASAEELTSLKGVGKVLAGRIVEHRLKKGLFISVEDLKNVTGIGDKLFSGIKDDVSLE